MFLILRNAKLVLERDQIYMNQDQIQNDSSYFIEKDLALSSFLMASEGVRFIKAQKEASGTVYFYFQPKNEAKKLASAYWSDTALIAPRKVLMAERSLKDLIFSGGTSG